MTKRRRLLLGTSLVATLVVVGVMVLWLAAPKHRINEESFKLIREGMTQQEVEAILRVPPGDYSNGGFVVRVEFANNGYSLMDDKDQKKFWTDNDLQIMVNFDPSGKVHNTRCYLVIPPETFLDRFRSWLRL